MATHSRLYWRKVGNLLKKSLDPQCAMYGKRRSYADLEFDCIIPQGHWHHKVETDRRISFYRKQFRAGNLQLLCAEWTKDQCHLKKTLTENGKFPF